jgi:hypothetical protein
LQQWILHLKISGANPPTPDFDRGNYGARREMLLLIRIMHCGGGGIGE